MNKLIEWKNCWVSTWRKYPICLIGYDIRRWENQQYDYHIGEFINKFIWFKLFSDKGPTHIQYNSPYGFLIQWPLCFHVWYQFKFQEEGKPGTEKIFYTRIGIARWDLDGYHLPTFYPPWTGQWD